MRECGAEVMAMSIREKLFDPGREGLPRDFGLLLMRVGYAGTLLMLHGLGKFERLLGGSFKFPDPLGIGSGLSFGLATFAEFFCAIALLLGFASRVATLPLIATMGVAVFVVHAGDPMHKKELALLYLAGFVVLLLTGPGRFSFDEILSKKK